LRLDIVVYVAEESVGLVVEPVVARPDVAEDPQVQVVAFLRLQGRVCPDGGSVA